MLKIKLLILIAFVAAAGLYVHQNSQKTEDRVKAANSTIKKVQKTVDKAKSVVNYCLTNKADQEVVVSISARHMWACAGKVQKYDSAVVTGYSGYAETVTPKGTYTIANKETDQRLKGSDRLGSWDVHVDYWLPFLYNQYGWYGFHDATWRDSSEFGAVSPSSKKASHGCVELPHAAMKWLYGWADTSTAVTVKS